MTIYIRPYSAKLHRIIELYCISHNISYTIDSKDPDIAVAYDAIWSDNVKYPGLSDANTIYCTTDVEFIVQLHQAHPPQSTDNGDNPPPSDPSDDLSDAPVNDLGPRGLPPSYSWCKRTEIGSVTKVETFTAPTAEGVVELVAKLMLGTAQKNGSREEL